jgi:hypothetical protein
MSTYPIPDAALDDRLGWIGTSGSGKTYNAGGGVERLLSTGARVVIVDPLGVWWGLRLRADGNAPSPFNAVIFGGPHGDLPLTEHAGALIGETAGSMSESCVIDLSELGSKTADRRFMTAFLESIYRKASGEPFHLVVDEADLFAPQKPGKGDEVLLGHMENIVRRGRIKGFIPWLISQRPAVLNKNVLSQVDGLVAFMLTASQDRDALDAWIEGQAERQDARQIKDSLPTLPVGTGVVWLPRRTILETVAFPPKRTFDSSRTPKRGEKVRPTAAFKPLDVEGLKGRIAAVAEEVKANDPKALKAEIVRLKADLAKATDVRSRVAQPDPAAIKAAEDVAYQRGHNDGHLAGYVFAKADSAREVLAVGEKMMREAGEAPPAPQAPRASILPPVKAARPAPRVAQPADDSAEGGTPEFRLSGPGRRILDAIAWWSALGIAAPTNEQVAFLAGYSSAGSGGYLNPRSALSAAKMISYPAPNCVQLTEVGFALASAPDHAPSTAVLHDRVMAKKVGGWD